MASKMLLSLVLLLPLVGCQYTPDWPSIDSRPLPAWYDEAKVGIFMHWGPYSVPGVSSEWFWYQWNRRDPNNAGDMAIVKHMAAFYPPDFTYQQFGPQFRAEFFNATEWAELIASSGAGYFVLTSKHHDGFAMWPSSRTFGWNAKDVGPKRDVVGEMAEAIRAQGGVRFGLYHSLFEWYHPLYLQDKGNNRTTRDFVLQKMGPELKELIRTYKPEVLWSDGEWEAPTEYWDSLNFLSWLYNESPVKDTIVSNDRWGSGTLCKHGGFFTCTDRYNPGVLQAHKWENAMTVDRQSWGHRRNMQLKDVLSMDELIETLVITVSCGGNLLMNIGPSSDGSIEPIFQERLRQMGTWLAVNGEGIYQTNPWQVQNDTLNSKVWYTSKVEAKDGVVLFAHVLGWPENGLVQLGSVTANPSIKVSLLGFEGLVEWSEGSGLVAIEVRLPDRASVQSNWGYVLKLTGVGKGGNTVWK